MENVGSFPKLLQHVMRSKISVTFNLSLTPIWRARSPSVNATRVKDRDRSRRSISSATSRITDLPLSRLAQTRWFSGRGGMDLSREVRHEVGNKLSRTCCGV